VSANKERLSETLGRMRFDYSSAETARMLGEIRRRAKLAEQRRTLLAASGALLVVLCGGLLLGQRFLASSPLPDAQPSLLASPLPDGSRMVVLSGDPVRLIHVSKDNMSLEVTRGRVRFEVTKRPTRSFEVRAGDVRVHVVGTVFEVSRDNDNVKVEVFEGRVRVLRLDQQERLLSAGEAMTLPAFDVPFADDAVGASPARQEAESSSTSERTPKKEHRAKSSSSSGRERGEHPQGKVTRFATLVAEAEASLTRGELIEAERIYAQAADEGLNEAQRPVIVFRRALLLLQDLKQPRRAARVFAELDVEGTPHALREDAAAREVEAWLAAGELGLAKAKAKAFIERFPESYRRETVEKARRE
jgi:FecR protein